MRTMRGGFDTDLFRDSGDVRRRGMTEQSEKISENLKAARDRDPEVDLVLDTTSEDMDWIRGKRRGGHAKDSDPKRGRDSGGRRERPREP